MATLAEPHRASHHGSEFPADPDPLGLLLARWLARAEHRYLLDLDQLHTLMRQAALWGDHPIRPDLRLITAGIDLSVGSVDRLHQRRSSRCSAGRSCRSGSITLTLLLGVAIGLFHGFRHRQSRVAALPS